VYHDDDETKGDAKMTTKTPHQAVPLQPPVTESAKPAEKNVQPTSDKSRNIAVAYEPVELTEEDAEVLREVSETPEAPKGRPTRPPRKMADS
jgi:hypothetical protein